VLLAAEVEAPVAASSCLHTDSRPVVEHAPTVQPLRRLAGTFQVSPDAYDRHVGRYGPQLSAALIDFAGVREGMRAIDVGCGPGALTTALVTRLGAENVSAADPSEPFAEACRSRLPGVDVIVAKAERLPFADDEFDAALSQLVVNFMTDAHAGIRELGRVTKPGGVIASSVWDYKGQMTLLRVFWDAAAEVEPERAAAEDEGPLMEWCDDGGLARLWRECGLEDVRFDALDVSADYDDFEDLWAPLTAGIGPAGAFCVSLDDDARAALHDALRRRLGVGDEPFRLTARAWAAAGTVPD
jgi:SAM-dependent methyltransferase